MTQICALQMPSWLARPSLLGPTPSTTLHTTHCATPFVRTHRGRKQIRPLIYSSRSTRQKVSEEDELTRAPRPSGSL